MWADGQEPDMRCDVSRDELARDKQDLSGRFWLKARFFPLLVLVILEGDNKVSYLFKGAFYKSGPPEAGKQLCTEGIGTYRGRPLKCPTGLKEE